MCPCQKREDLLWGNREYKRSAIGLVAKGAVTSVVVPSAVPLLGHMDGLAAIEAIRRDVPSRERSSRRRSQHNFQYRLSQWPYGIPLTGSAQARRRCSVALFAPTYWAGAAARYDARQR